MAGQQIGNKTDIAANAAFGFEIGDERYQVLLLKIRSLPDDICHISCQAWQKRVAGVLEATFIAPIREIDVLKPLNLKWPLFSGHRLNKHGENGAPKLSDSVQFLHTDL